MKKYFPFVLAAVLVPSFLQAEVFKIDSNTAPNKITIDMKAPQENIKAEINQARGEIQVDRQDPSKTTGMVEVDLSDIRSYTFKDEGKNAKQTEHMKNWFEVGPDVSSKDREKNRWARFVIRKVASIEGKGPYHIVVDGDFTVHGITKPKQMDLDVSFSPDGKTMEIKTRKPFVITLKEHDVKPRDAAGKFLSSALNLFGVKVAEEAQVSLNLKVFQPK